MKIYISVYLSYHQCDTLSLVLNLVQAEQNILWLNIPTKGCENISNVLLHERLPPLVYTQVSLNLCVLHRTTRYTHIHILFTPLEFPQQCRNDPRYCQARSQLQVKLCLKNELGLISVNPASLFSNIYQWMLTK